MNDVELDSLKKKLVSSKWPWYAMLHYVDSLDVPAGCLRLSNGFKTHSVFYREFWLSLDQQVGKPDQEQVLTITSG
jgi:hypothetical protein